MSANAKEEPSQVPVEAIVSLLERIANAVERQEGLPRNDIYEQLLRAKDKEIRDLKEQLQEDKDGHYSNGYSDGYRIGIKRIQNVAYKIRKQGNVELANAMLEAAKIKDE